MAKRHRGQDHLPRLQRHQQNDEADHDHGDARRIAQQMLELAFAHVFLNRLRSLRAPCGFPMVELPAITNGKARPNVPLDNPLTGVDRAFPPDIIAPESPAVSQGSAMSRKIIIDTDPGQDDAVAILLALASPQELDVLGIVAVAGNVGLHHNANNALKVVELSGRTDIPVYAGCARPMRRPSGDRRACPWRNRPQRPRPAGAQDRAAAPARRRFHHRDADARPSPAPSPSAPWAR